MTPWLSISLVAFDGTLIVLGRVLCSEVSFYNNALEAVKRGRSLLVAANVPYKRPEDFLCEMVKTDAHMDKVQFFLRERDFVLPAPRPPFFCGCWVRCEARLVQCEVQLLV